MRWRQTPAADPARGPSEDPSGPRARVQPHATGAARACGCALHPLRPTCSHRRGARPRPCTAGARVRGADLHSPPPAGAGGRVQIDVEGGTLSAKQRGRLENHQSFGPAAGAGKTIRASLCVCPGHVCPGPRAAPHAVSSAQEAPTPASHAPRLTPYTAACARLAPYAQPLDPRAAAASAGPPQPGGLRTSAPRRALKGGTSRGRPGGLCRCRGASAAARESPPRCWGCSPQEHFSSFSV